jgi:hypothetical protein
MKKLLFTGIFFILFFALSAQVTLEKKYNYSASVVKLETQGYKYYLMDVPNSQCRIYNLDHSVFRTINCAVPNNFYLADIKHISENLFDNDDGIELIYTYYKYNTAKAYYEYESKIINEDGSEIISAIKGAQYVYVNKTDDDIYKLFAYCFDYSVFPEKVWTNIYNLPGAPIVSAYLQKDDPNILLNAFPNPASETVKVAYSLPENVNTGKLHLFDNNGKSVSQFIIDNHTDFLSLDISQYNSGVYHYFIEYENTRTPSKKLVIR